MEQQPPEAATVSRGQNTVHVVAGDWAAAPAALTRLLERATAASDAVQAVVLVADADAAVGVVDALVAARGGVPPRVVAATGAARTARVLRAGAAPVVVGAPAQIVALVRASALKLDQVTGLAVAWVEEILAAGGGPDLEAVMAEVPKDVPRTILTTTLGPPVEDFIERYARRAPRFGVPPAAPAPTAALAPAFAPALTPVHATPDGPDRGPATADSGSLPSSAPVAYVVATPSARASVLRRLLDEVDPPSAAIYVRTDESERAVRHALLVLGYHGDNAALRVVRSAVTDHSALLVLFDLPHDADELRGATGGVPGRTVAFLLPRQLGHLNTMTDGPIRPFVFAGPVEAARGREEAVRSELRRELATGSLAREVLSLEPLLAEFDGIALAAASLRLLERHRQTATAASAAPAIDRSAARPSADTRAAVTPDPAYSRPSSGGHGPPRTGGSSHRGGYAASGSSGGGARPGARGESRGGPPSRGGSPSRGGPPGRGGPPDRGGPPGRGGPGASRDGGRRPGGERGGRGR